MLTVLDKITGIIVQTQEISIFTLGFGVFCFIIYNIRTMIRYDKRISLHDQAILGIKDDIKEIKQDVKETLRIFNSRIQDIPIIIDKRRNNNNN